MRPLNYKFASLEEVMQATDLAKHLALDFETDGFYGHICLAQFKQRDWTATLLVKDPEIFTLAAFLKKAKLVIHSANYEIATVQANLAKALEQGGSGWVPNDWEDTLLLSRLAFPKLEKHSLDSCYEAVFNSCLYKAHGLQKSIMQKSNWKTLDKDKMTYAAIDVHYLLQLYDAVKHMQDTDSYKLDKLATGHICELQKGGLAINLVEARQRRDENNRKIAEYNLPINVNSYQQVRPYIGEVESEDTALAKFASQGNERAKNVRTVRGLVKQNSFLTSYLDNHTRGRLFGKYAFTTRSGRGKCSDMNLQQLPRAFKDLFEAPPGRVRVMSDYSQLELRMACAIANEVTMAKLFKGKEDLHTFTAERVHVTRQVGKTCNFNLIYGGSANMLQQIMLTSGDVAMPIEEVRTIKRKWHSLWPNLTAWQNKMSSVYRHGGLVKTILGRVMKPNLYTDAMNLPVQGSSAEVSKLALHYQVQAIEKADLEGVIFCNFVHDSFDWECDDNPAVYKPLAKIVGDSMLDAWQQVVQHTPIPDLPMPVSVEVGKNWGKMEKGNEQPLFIYEV